MYDFRAVSQSYIRAPREPQLVTSVALTDTSRPQPLLHLEHWSEQTWVFDGQRHKFIQRNIPISIHVMLFYHSLKILDLSLFFVNHHEQRPALGNRESACVVDIEELEGIASDRCTLQRAYIPYTAQKLCTVCDHHRKWRVQVNPPVQLISPLPSSSGAKSVTRLQKHSYMWHTYIMKQPAGKAGHF